MALSSGGRKCRLRRVLKRSLSVLLALGFLAGVAAASSSDPERNLQSHDHGEAGGPEREVADPVQAEGSRSPRPQRPARGGGESDPDRHPPPEAQRPLRPLRMQRRRGERGLHVPGCRSTPHVHVGCGQMRRAEARPDDEAVRELSIGIEPRAACWYTNRSSRAPREAGATGLEPATSGVTGRLDCSPTLAVSPRIPASELIGADRRTRRLPSLATSRYLSVTKFGPVMARTDRASYSDESVTADALGLC